MKKNGNEKARKRVGNSIETHVLLDDNNFLKTFIVDLKYENYSNLFGYVLSYINDVSIFCCTLDGILIYNRAREKGNSMRRKEGTRNTCSRS